MLTSVNSENKQLPEKVAEQIVELIANRQYMSGDKLPNEFEMAGQLQVGRGTIREAMKILVSRNIVEIRRGCGTFVCKHPGRVEDPLGFSFVENKKKLALDLYELRMIIEPEIAALAAQRGEPEDIRRLREAAKRVEELCRKGEDHAREDMEFHEQLAKCSHNQVMPRLMPVIHSAVSIFIEMTNSGLRMETIRSHEAIVKAVEHGNQEEARAAMREHLQNNWNCIFSLNEG